MTNGFVTIPRTFDLVSELIHASTSITMSKVFGVVILKGLFCHWKSPVRFEICDWWSSRTSVLLARTHGTCRTHRPDTRAGCDGCGRTTHLLVGALSHSGK